MQSLYQLTGQYQKPYYHESYFPDSENETNEEIHYRQSRPVERILGVYQTEDEAKDALKRFSEYSVIVEKKSGYTARHYPYKKLSYHKMTIGDREVLPPPDLSDDE